MSSPVNLLEGDFLCCGTLCPKQEAQDHIDRMQRAIDTAHELLEYGGLPEDVIVGLRLELKKLSSK